MTQAPKPRELLDVPLMNPLDSKLDFTPRSRPQIGPVPRSNLLSKLRNFMPEMQQANQQLERQMQERPAQDFDIEHVTDSEGEQPYIEMDLACGVVELRDAASLQAAERAMSGQLPEQHSSSEEDSDSNSDHDSDSDDGLGLGSSGREAVVQEQQGAKNGQQAGGSGVGGDGGEPMQGVVAAGQPISGGGKTAGQRRKRLAAKRKGNPKIQEL